ncbi:hypothetical protein DLAC_02712 [Tieghemostelium lacteum]|uniref:Leucine-rich repeat-containing protein (LRR) n=1 Tax=Tieghemostelium lacteum TaxID=361077 RepID=A0A152A3J1_TIELA|nr:hypothetical protein DLAC_02712 [Tieghemostelium lacteum]|eukprot:KYR00675.1 hypothetical protein DLAC_02712 [Tieghemostelium lacteum]
MQQPDAFSFNFENLCGSDSVCPSISQTDDNIQQKLRNHEKLELNELPKSILVEILKHLNDQYSCTTPTKPQNPFFHNYCYSDQMTNGKDGKDRGNKKYKKDISSKDSGNCDQIIPTPAVPMQQNNKYKEISNNDIIQGDSACIYIKDIINLSLVCKFWARCVVPVSISSFIKISSRRELLTFQKFMTKGIIPGGLPCMFSTIKFHNNKQLHKQQHQQQQLQSGFGKGVCKVNPITAQDYKDLLESCYNVKSLCFGTSVLGLSEMTEISQYLKNCCNITEMKINTNFCSQGFQIFLDALRVNQSITYLDISSNPLSRECLVMLVDVLKVNKTINYLDLSFSDIGINGVLLAEFIKQNTAVQSLFLIGNQLDNDSVSAISEALKTKNTTITELSLSENDFDDEVGSAIGEIFLNNRSIKTIDLSFNGLGSGTIQGFSEALLCGGQDSFSSCLESMNLSDCSMSENEEAGIQFFRALQMNKKVKTLVLWSCDLASQRVKDELALAIKNNTTLTELSLGFNELTSDDISVLVHKGLKHNKTLTNVSFNNNYISTVGGIIFADYLKHNDTIREVSLFDNCLDNCAAIEFMNTLCTNHNIRKLCLGSNRICPNLTQVFRKLLQYNRSTPKLSNYNNSRQQWISTKLHFLKSELTKLNLKFDQQTQLSNSIRELFKVLNLNCSNINQQQQQNQQFATNRANQFLNVSLLGQCKISSPQQQQQQQQHQTSMQKSPLPQQTFSQPPLQLQPPMCPSSSNTIIPLIQQSNNHLWHGQSSSTSSTSSTSSLVSSAPPSTYQHQQQQMQMLNSSLFPSLHQSTQLPMSTFQKPMFQQPLFQYNNCNQVLGGLNNPPQSNMLQQTHFNNITSPLQSNLQTQSLQPPLQQQQQQQQIYQRQNISRQFEDELIQLQSQLQLDINNTSQFLTNNNTNSTFNTFF